MAILGVGIDEPLYFSTSGTTNDEGKIEIVSNNVEISNTFNSGDTIFKCNTAGGALKSLIKLNPDTNEGGVFFLDDKLLFTRTANNTFFDNFLGDLSIRNLVHGGLIYVITETTGGVSKILLTANGDQQTILFGKSISLFSESLTISGGVITQTGSNLLIDTELGAATDDLDTITATGPNGTIIVCSAADPTHTIVFKDDTGNLRLAGDFSADHNHDTITLIFKSPNWIELSRSNNN